MYAKFKALYPKRVESLRINIFIPYVMRARELLGSTVMPISANRSEFFFWRNKHNTHIVYVSEYVHLVFTNTSEGELFQQYFYSRYGKGLQYKSKLYSF